MKTIPLAACVLTLLAGAVLCAVVKPFSEPDSTEPRAATAEALSDLRREIEHLRVAQETSRQQLSDLLARIAESGEASPVASASKADEPVEEKKPDRAVEDVHVDAHAEGAVDADAVFLDESIDSLLDPQKGENEKQKVWNKLVSRGLLDRAIAFFEDYARENFGDPNAQTVLGHACIQKLLTVNDIQKGKWLFKADRAYDKALALDDRHWESRYAKAITYSFTPPILGLQPKAVEQFEILRRQQEEVAPEPHYAQTYLLLGNLYANQSNQTKARETWEAGLKRFPDHADLRGQLESGDRSSDE